jgi:hypothetical protein
MLLRRVGGSRDLLLVLDHELLRLGRALDLILRNVAFEVDDLQAAVDRLAADGYGLVGGIGQYEHTWRMAYVRGPTRLAVPGSLALPKESSASSSRSATPCERIRLATGGFMRWEPSRSPAT